jgi:hypothetical protein
LSASDLAHLSLRTSGNRDALPVHQRQGLRSQSKKAREPMDTGDEKRAFQRRAYEAAITFSYFNQKITHRATLFNFSEGGFSFYSRIPIKQGTTILIKLETLSTDSGPGQTHSGLKTVSLAETRWCRKIPESLGIQYEIGAKFFFSE